MTSLTGRDNNLDMDNRNRSFSFIWKIIFLFVLSLLMCSVGPFALFAPVPLTFAFLLFGRQLFLLSSSLIIISTFAVSTTYPAMAPLGGFFILSFIYSLLIGEMIVRNLHPQKIVTYSTGIVLLILLSLIVLFFSISEITFVGWLRTVVDSVIETVKISTGDQLNSSSEQAQAIKEFIENPVQIVTEIKHWFLPFLFTGICFSIWGSLMIILRNSLVWSKVIAYDFDIQDLVSFKSPYVFVYPLIVGLVLMLIGPQQGIPFDVIGGNIVYCLGVIYFFQGFGVFSDLLTHWNVFGVMRSFVTILFILTAWKVLAIVGVLDTWINFRKFFKDKNKGDMA